MVARLVRDPQAPASSGSPPWSSASARTLLPVIERRLAMAAGALVAVLVLAFLGLRFTAFVGTSPIRIRETSPIGKGRGPSRSDGRVEGLRPPKTSPTGRGRARRPGEGLRGPRKSAIGLKSVTALARHWPWVALLASAALVAIAHAFQTFGHLSPCELCLKQRDLYWAAMGHRRPRTHRGAPIRTFPDPARLVALLLALVFLAETALRRLSRRGGMEVLAGTGPRAAAGATRVDPAELETPALRGQDGHSPVRQAGLGVPEP